MGWLGTTCASLADVAICFAHGVTATWQSSVGYLCRIVGGANGGLAIGRPFGVFVQENSTRIQLSAKDVKTPGAEKFVMQGNFRAEFGDKTFYGANNMKLKDQKAYLVKEAEDIKGNEVKMPYFGKIFEETAEKKEWKREERSTLESPPKKAKKNIISKESDSIEEIVVMDYAQPHRKPPIHNKEP
ncbi:Uncharacterized protein Adt_40619 [Abeliophyllum distichum]|uniref:Ysc84 actin-binding domain-containing protein n=1 Tax=Abeliophyllum distichum TaxID=126358 RepID=A0ABD1Q8G1_9LAMI